MSQEEDDHHKRIRISPEPSYLLTKSATQMKEHDNLKRKSNQEMMIKKITRMFEDIDADATKTLPWKINWCGIETPEQIEESFKIACEGLSDDYHIFTYEISKHSEYKITVDILPRDLLK